MKKLFVVIISLISINSISFQGAAQDKKNVLFIAVDDLKPELACYGHPEIISPNIDQLAEKGVLFLKAYCQQAVCAPSRASLLTGLRPDETKVWDLKTIMRDHVPNVLTMPQYFRQNGYETVALGKIFDPRSVDKKLDELSWSIPYKSVNTKDYPEEFGVPFAGRWQLKETKEKAAYYHKIAIEKGMKGQKANVYAMGQIKPSTETVDGPDEVYEDGQIAANAIGLMRKLSKGDKPFFLAVGFHKPHLPFNAPKKYWDLYNSKNMELSLWQQKPINGPDIAMHNWGELKSYIDIPGEIMSDGRINENKQRELIHAYFACISYVDAQIGKLMDELKKEGLEKNTVIVLWGDHGWHLGDHGLWCKHSNFEQATHAPLIFVDPNYKGKIKNNSTVEFVDIFPTLTELTGLATPPNLPGKSLVPIMQGKTAKVKDFAVSQYPRGKDVMGYSLRTADYRYTEWHKSGYRSYDRYNPANIIATELYDYKTDPLETVNLIDSAEYRDIKEKLAFQLESFLEK